MIKQCLYQQVGLATLFKQLLSKKVSTDDYFFLFHKSLNVKTQTNQRDFHVRLREGDLVILRYLNSQFIGHATAANLKDAFEKSADELPRAHLLHKSQNGPNANS